jgi:hypothetical protein
MSGWSPRRARAIVRWCLSSLPASRRFERRCPPSQRATRRCHVSAGARVLPALNKPWEITDFLRTMSRLQQAFIWHRQRPRGLVQSLRGSGRTPNTGLRGPPRAKLSGVARLAALGPCGRRDVKFSSGRLEVLMDKSIAGGSIEQVAGNGLLHRRALLGRGLAFAGTAGIATGLPTGAAAEALAESPWSLEPGDPIPPYQQPSKFAKDVVRTLANPNFEPRTSQSRTPHHLLDGMITPNGVFFTIVHGGIPAIDPNLHQLLIHGLVKRPLVFTRDSMLRYPMTSRICFIECGGNSAPLFSPQPVPGTSRLCMDWFPARNGRASGSPRCSTKSALIGEPNGSSPKARTRLTSCAVCRSPRDWMMR